MIHLTRRAEQVFQLLAHKNGGKWFKEKSVGAQPGDAAGSIGVGRSGDHHDGHGAMQRVRADALDQLEAVHLAHFKVGDDGGDGSLLENFPGALGAERGDDVDLRQRAEQQVESGSAGVDIVDHQDGAAHFFIIGERFPGVVKSL